MSVMAGTSGAAAVRTRTPSTPLLGFVSRRQLGQIVVVGGALSGLVAVGHRVGFDFHRPGRWCRRVEWRLVDEAPPHVDGVAGKEGPLEDVGPTQLVPTQGAAHLPDAERGEDGDDDDNQHMEPDGPTREPHVSIQDGYRVRRKRKSDRMSANSNGRSP